MKRKKWQIGQRISAALLAAVMITTSIQPFPIFAAEGDTDAAASPIASLDFNSVTGTGLTGSKFVDDAAGANAAVVTDEEFTLSERTSNHYLDLTGEKYLTVTNENGKSPLAGQDSVSIVYKSYLLGIGSNDYWSFFADNTGETADNSHNYFGLIESTGGLKDSANGPYATRLEAYDATDQNEYLEIPTLTTGVWKEVAVVIEALADGKATMYLYQDGTLKGSRTLDAMSLKTVLGEDGGTFWIGKSNYGGEFYNGYIDDFQIYQGALTGEEVAALHNSDKAPTGNAVLADFDFEKGIADATAGTVTYTDATGKAKAVYDYSELKKIWVKEEVKDKALDLRDANKVLYVTEKDGTPILEGKESVTIVYDSYKEAGEGGWAFFGADDIDSKHTTQKYFGAIENLDNTIAATRYNGATNQRHDTPVSATGAWKNVAVTYSPEGVCVYVNGVLAGGTLASTANMTLSEILGKDGGIFQIGKGNFGNPIYDANGNPTGEFYNGMLDNFQIYNGALTEAEVETLYNDNIKPNATEHALLAEFTFDDEETGFTSDNAVARPYLTYDTDKDGDLELYLVDSNKTWLDLVNADGTPLLAGAEELTISYKSKIFDKNKANWAFYAAANKDAQNAASQNYIGITDQSDFVRACVYDSESNVGSYPTWTNDLGTTMKSVDVVIAKADNSTYSVTMYIDNSKEAEATGLSLASLSSILGTGGILQIGKGNFQNGAEYFSGYLDDVVIRDYALTEKDIEARNHKRIAYFDFDDEKTGLSGDGAVASVISGGKLDIRNTTDAYLDGAFYFDGKTGLDVKTEGGGSLLTGLTEMTVSFYSKPDKGANDYWGFYAAPNSSTQAYQQEHYLGIIAKPEEVKAERYNNSGSRPKSAEITGGLEGSTDDGWDHIVVVYSETQTIIYVNGEAVSTVGSNYSLIDILGDSSILQIGKANWVNGEYYKGYIDEYSIYNYAMTKAEVEAMEPKEELIAYFSFDENYTNGQGATATANGTPTITSVSANAYLGNALDLDGTDDFLAVTAEDGSPLLTDVREMTVSFYSKPDADSVKYWALYAAPNGNNIIWTKQSYVAVNADNSTDGTTDNITAERINLGEGSPTPEADASYSNASIGDGWHHIVAVFGLKETTIYVDGQKGTTVSSVDSLSAILGEESVCYIGKAMWEYGQYFKGSIDELKIFNYAMTADEVKTNLIPEPMWEKERIAYFNFDDDTLGAIDSTEVLNDEDGNAKATMQAGVPSITNEDSYNGQSLKLNGSSALKVTDKDGKPLLTGLDEITVSYYSLLQVDATAHNYTFYAAPSKKENISNTDSFVGILDYGERADNYLKWSNVDYYRRSGESGDNDWAGLTPERKGMEWHHVVVVFGRDNTKVYLDGEYIETSEGMDSSLRNILGEDSILYVGKSNWAAGDWYDGYIDEYSIYNYAMTDAEVKALEPTTYNEVTLNVYNTTNGAMSYTSYKDFTIDGVKMDDNATTDADTTNDDSWRSGNNNVDGTVKDDGEGRRLDIPVTYDAKGELNITLPDNDTLASGFRLYEGDKEHTIVQSEDVYQWKLVGWYNIATGAHYDVTHGPITVKISEKDANVFYADWEAANYNYGSATDAGLLETADTSSFVKTYVFDYNELFNVKAAKVVQSGTSSEFWRAINGTEPYFTLVDDASHRDCWRDGTIGTAYDRKEKNLYQNTQRTGIVTDATNGVHDELIQHLFYPTSTELGVNYLGMGNYLFSYDEETETYSYDSDLHGAVYNQSEQRFYVYDKPKYHTPNTGGAVTGLFPFNDFDAPLAYNNGSTNNWFGMSVKVDFYLPNDTGVEGGNQLKGQDMVFEFSGDDDVWVFVDDELVLDLGGIHHRVDGSIDFSTGVVNYITTNETETIDVKAGSHTLSIFYMERGGNESNCQMSFNLAPRWEMDPPEVNTATVSKVWQHTPTEKQVPIKVALFDSDGNAVPGSNVILSSENKWKHTWEGLDASKEYEVRELTTLEDNYTSKVYEVEDEYSYWAHADSGDLTDGAEIVLANGIEGNGEYYKGYLDEYRIYGRALTADEVSAMYAGTIPSENQLAYFSFDDASTALSGNGAAATVMSGGILNVNTEDKYSGTGSLYFDGNTGLNVTATNGDSLLTGLEEVTVSFYAKSEADGGMWAFYAAPDTDTQIYLEKEIYTGILARMKDGQTNVVADRFNRPTGITGNRPDVATGSVANNSWNHIVVVYGATETTVYVNGVAGKTIASNYSLTDILGDVSILQIGKGNYGENGKLLSTDLKNHSAIIANHVIEADSVTEDTKWTVEISTDGFFYLERTVNGSLEYLSIADGTMMWVTSTDSASRFGLRGETGDLYDSGSEYRLSVGKDGDIVVGKQTHGSEISEDRVHICMDRTITSKVFAYEITNSYLPDVTITKVDKYSNNPLQGIYFVLFRKNAAGASEYYYYNTRNTEDTSDDVVEWMNIPSALVAMPTDKDGKITLGRLEPGTYYLREVGATGYQLITTPIEFTLTVGKSANTLSTTADASLAFVDENGASLNLVIKNEPTIPVKLQKVDESGNGLAGAAFKLYGSDYYVDGAVNAEAKVVASLASGEDGYLTMLSTVAEGIASDITMQYLIRGTYYLVEDVVPDGYQRLSGPVVITVDAEGLKIEMLDEWAGSSEDRITSEVVENVQVYTITLPNIAKESEEFFVWRTKETELPFESIKGIYDAKGNLQTKTGYTYETEDFTVTLEENGLTFTGNVNGNVTITYQDDDEWRTEAVVHVYEPKNWPYVLDYGLPVDLNQAGDDSLGISAATEAGTGQSYSTIAGENLSIKGVTSVAQLQGFRVHEESTDNWDNYSATVTNTDIGALNWDAAEMTVLYTPQDFMDEADVYDYRVDVKKTVDTTISSPKDGVMMAGTVTVVPAEVVYYEDDFTAITVTGPSGKEGKTGDLMQSNDQDGVYGYDEAYTIPDMEDDLILHYDFSKISTAVDGTIVPDMTGNGNDGTIHQNNATVSGNVLTLPGGASNSGNAYMEFPTDQIEGKEAVTISVWLKNETNLDANNLADHMAMYIGTYEDGYPDKYWMLNPHDRNGNIRSVVTVKSSYSGEKTVTSAAVDSTWGLYTAVVEANNLTLYYNGGSVVKTIGTEGSIADMGNALVGYIGTSPYRNKNGTNNGDAYFAGDVRDVRIYDRALTASEIAYLYSGEGNTTLDSAGSSTRLDSNGNNVGDYGTMKFTFTGTGFDIVGRTTTDTASIYVNVHCISDNSVKDKNYFLKTYYANGELYQLPLISNKELPYGTYEVTIEAVHDQNPNAPTIINRSVYIDGIRIYNPAGAGVEDEEVTDITDLYLRTEYKTDEPEVKDMLLGSVKFENLEAMLEALEVQNGGAIPEDGTTLSEKSTVSLVTLENGEEGNLIISHGGTTVVEDIISEDTATTPYLENILSRGPNNEVYLAKGNAIAFLAVPDTTTIGSSGTLLIPEDERTLQIEAKKVDGEDAAPAVLTSLTAAENANGDYDAQEAQSINLRTYTQMYYEIDLSKCSDYEYDGGVAKLVVLASTGDSMVSLTNLKVKGYTFKALTETESVTETYAMVKQLYAAYNGRVEDEVADIPFTDVEAGSWYEASVRYAYEQGIMTGVSKTEFAPAKEITRAEFAVILHRMAGSPAAEYESRFPDVTDGEFYTEAIMWASRVGIITGYVSGDKAGCFGVADPITREQVAAMLYSYAAFAGEDVSASADLTGYPDIEQMNAYAEESMSWAVAEGLIRGSNGMLDPQGHANRAMVAAIMQRFLEQ